MKILFTVNIPSPYRVDFFNELGKYCDLTVLFESHAAKDRDINWTPDSFSNFKGVFLKGFKIGQAEAFCPSVVKYLTLKKYDVIIIGMYSSPTGMLSIQYMRSHKVPFILSSDGGMIKEDTGFKQKLKAHFIGSASAWLSTGQTTTKYLVNYGADPRYTYIYPFTSIRENNILKSPLTKQEKESYRKKLGMKEEKIVLSVGRFIPIKGYDILLKAIAKLDETIGLYLVGGNPTEEYLSIKQELHLNNVHFVDFLKKDLLADYYKAADLFVLPTRGDAWGLVINEAMAYGLPVITTDKCVAGLEMIDNNLNGTVVPVDDVNALSSAINENIKITHQKTSEVLYTARRYTIEKMASEHMRLIELYKENYHR